MRVYNCRGCKVADNGKCGLGYTVTKVEYTDSTEYVSKIKCPRPTSFRRAKDLLAEVAKK